MLILRIIFHGLIAFVPSPHNSQMTALLVASREDHSQCIAVHMADLIFPTAESDKCRKAGCTYDAKNNCNCTLNHQSIAFQLTALPASTEPGHQPPKILPTTKDSAADMSYLVNMSNLGYDILRTAVTGDPGKLLVARMVFPYTRLTACDLTADESDDDLLHSYNFHPYNSAQRGWDQPLAQGLVTEADVPSGEVSLVLNKLGASGSPIAFKLTAVCANQKCTAEVRLENMRSPVLDECNNGIGRDFAFYYDLTTLPPSFAFRPVPHIDDLASDTTVEDLEPVVCPPRPIIHDVSTEQRIRAQGLRKQLHRQDQLKEHLFSVDSHPVCAMAVFYPYQ